MNKPKLIVVEYYPCGEPSPFPDPNEKEWVFESHEDFKSWVQGYVCVHCLVDFNEFVGRKPETLKDWLHMGCGCEIGVTDVDNTVNWEDRMILPDNFEQVLDDYQQMMADAFARHG